MTAQGEIWLWDALSTRSIAHTAAHGAGEHLELAFNPAGTLLVTSAHDGTIRCWDGATLEPVGLVIKMTAWVRTVAISPDGGSIAAGDQNGRLGFWDARTGKALAPAGGVCRIA